MICFVVLADVFDVFILAGGGFPPMKTRLRQHPSMQNVAKLLTTDFFGKRAESQY